MIKLAKIIISPSKTQNFSNKVIIKPKKPIFTNKTETLVNLLKALDKEKLASIMNIKEALLEEVYKSYQQYTKTESKAAILAYSGTVFREIKVEEYSSEERAFLENKVIILSALYGMLRPFDGIKPYRLDMNVKLPGINLYEYWSEALTERLKGEKIINLASGEFSKLIKLPMINIEFKECEKDGKYVVIGTYAKKARGLMVNYVVKNKVKSISQIKDFDLEGYSFNKGISSEKLIIFTR